MCRCEYRCPPSKSGRCKPAPVGTENQARFIGFSELCSHKKSREETPLGFCDINAPRSNPCFGRENPAYLNMAYFPDNDLHMAACAGDLSFVRLYIALGKYEVNYKDRDNRNAMHFACFYGHLELVIYLWRRGCEINVCDKHNITPLMKAVQSWEDDIVCFLLEHHANLHIKDSRGNTALHYAVYSGNSATAARLLQYGADIEERTKGKPHTTLACSQGVQTEDGTILSKDGSKRACRRLTAKENSLMYAVRCDSPVMVNLILQQGVDINFKDLFGWTALRYAIEGDRDVRTILLEYEHNLIKSLRERNQAFQSSENSSIRVSLSSPGCPGTHYVDKADLKLSEIHLLLPPEPINEAEAEVTSPTANESLPSAEESASSWLPAEASLLLAAFGSRCRTPSSFTSTIVSLDTAMLLAMMTMDGTSETKVIEMQDPLTTDEANMEKMETHRPESELEVISLEEEISSNETINNPQQSPGQQSAQTDAATENRSP
ncbi:POTE ankyrin domain family, member G-like [Apodemus speciosus]|uniref:POTE ankyrin domain family, member G-like n=1 Tax=Apodemus speciosus TaxID=105296 RepID=A0ABQ0EG04_APOSI